MVFNMDKVGHYAVIHYLDLKGLTPKKIHEDMVVTLGENALSYSMAKKLVTLVVFLLEIIKH